MSNHPPTLERNDAFQRRGFDKLLISLIELTIWRNQQEVASPISGTARFKAVTDTSKQPTKLIQPQSCSFTYSKKKATASVTYAAVRYVCYGHLRNASTWASINNDFRYTILCGRNNPTPSNFYSSSTPISSARGIDISGDPAGQLLTFELTINGTSYSFPGAEFSYS